MGNDLLFKLHKTIEFLYDLIIIYDELNNIIYRYIY